MKFRIMQTNALRGLLYEFGEVLPEGYRAFSKAFPAALARAAERLPAILIDSLREQWARAQDPDQEMAVLERRLASLFRDNPDCQKVADVPEESAWPAAKDLFHHAPCGLLVTNGAVIFISGNSHGYRYC
jgi:transposase